MGAVKDKLADMVERYATMPLDEVAGALAWSAEEGVLSGDGVEDIAVDPLAAELLASAHNFAVAALGVIAGRRLAEQEALRKSDREVMETVGGAANQADERAEQAEARVAELEAKLAACSRSNECHVCPPLRCSTFCLGIRENERLRRGLEGLERWRTIWQGEAIGRCQHPDGEWVRRGDIVDCLNTGPAPLEVVDEDTRRLCKDREWLLRRVDKLAAALDRRGEQLRRMARRFCEARQMWHMATRVRLLACPPVVWIAMGLVPDKVHSVVVGVYSSRADAEENAPGLTSLSEWHVHGATPVPDCEEVDGLTLHQMVEEIHSALPDLVREADFDDIPRWRDLKRWLEARARVDQGAQEDGGAPTVWVRVYSANAESNAEWVCDGGCGTDLLVVEVFPEDPGEYTWEHGTPYQFRVEVPVQGPVRSEVYLAPFLEQLDGVPDEHVLAVLSSIRVFSQCPDRYPHRCTALHYQGAGRCRHCDGSGESREVREGGGQTCRKA